MQLLQTQSTVSYIEQAMKADRSAFDNQLLQQKNTAIATAVQWRTYSIFFLVLAMAISAVLWLRWKSDNQSAQQAIQVLLQRYAKDIQQKKLSGHSSAEDSSYPQLAQQLRYLLETEKIHLQPNLKTEDLLQYLQISYKDLHQLLRSEFQSTFPQLINQYRVNTAQQLLGNPQNQDISLDEIAILSGFGTRQSFYKIFQAQMGVSPGTFRAYFFTTS
jgi:AraC-like DNA-binding protein